MVNAEKYITQTHLCRYCNKWAKFGTNKTAQLDILVKAMNITNATNLSPFEPSAGDTAFLFLCTTLVFLMTPGLSFFYGGLVNRKNVVSTILQSVVSLSVVMIQWWFLGYTLTFSPTGTPIIGDFKYILFIDVSLFTTAHPNAPTVPNLLYAFFQAMFASITPALIIGAMAERIKFRTYIIFVFLWSIVVYDFIAHWVWSKNGWLYQLGVLDLAGGAAVHMSSGMSGLVFALLLKSRKGYYTIWTPLRRKLRQKLFKEEPQEQNQQQEEKVKPNFQPHNVPYVILGTSLLWFGWMGFNGGSVTKSSSLATYAMVNTNMSAAAASLTWMFIDWIITGKPTAVAFCIGTVVGLVTVTPAAGFIYPGIAALAGFTGAIICYIAVKVKARLMDDSYDAFVCHGIGGTWGLIFTGIFATKDIPSMGLGETIRGGWWNGNWIQLPIQLAAVGAVFAWSVVITLILFVALQNFPGLGWNVPEEQEMVGLDRVEHGEVGHLLSQEDEEALSQYLSNSDSVGLAQMLIRLRKKVVQRTKAYSERRRQTKSSDNTNNAESMPPTTLPESIQVYNTTNNDQIQDIELNNVVIDQSSENKEHNSE
jgi:Amt family ammonium transporter